MRLLLLLCVSLGLSFSTVAQCQVNQLNINTGYNPATNSPYAIGTQDQYWSVTGLSQANQAVATNTPPYPSYVITPNGSYATNANSAWLSFLSNVDYATNANADSTYIMALSRSFNNCDADTFTFTLSFAADNWLSGIFVDGVSYYYQPATGASFYGSYNVIPTFSVYLTPGMHQVTASVFNLANTSGDNPTGFSLVGTITGTTTSLLSDTCTAGVPMVHITPHTDTICSGNSIALTATGTGTITWSPGTGLNIVAGTTVIASPTTTTLYHLFSTGFGCNLAEDSVLVFVMPGLTPSVITSNSPICAGDTIKITATNADPTARFNWAGPAGYINNTADVTIPASAVGNGGAYQLTTSNAYCSTTGTANMIVDFAQASFTVSADTICQNSSIMFTNNSTGATPSYLWNFGDGGTDNTASPTHNYTRQGTFLVTLMETGAGPCFDTTKMYVTVDSVGGINFTTSDSVLCQGKAITFNGSYLGIDYTGNTWDFGDGSQVNNANPIRHAYEMPGTYHVSLTAKYNVCPDTTYSKDITIHAYPILSLGPDTSMCPNASPIQLGDHINAGNTSAKWLWNTGDTTSGISAAQPGTYYVTVSLNGCSTADSIWVRNDCYLSIPNAFTPNNDGTNDYFFPRSLLSAGVTAFKMDIYDRWGVLIFETNNISGRGWDGKFNNKEQPDGVYIYIIDVQFKDGESESYKGNVTLLR